jgi:hypothetical protein
MQILHEMESKPTEGMKRNISSSRKMRSLGCLKIMQFFMPSSTLRLIVVVNALAALLTALGTLVLLLIAPLGLAAVLSCTLLVALLTFGAGMVGDLVIWRRLPSDGFDFGGMTAGLNSAAGLPFPKSETSQLPARRQR